MSTKDLGPQPDPVIEPGEPNPGGADAVDASDGVDGETATPNPSVPDLPPDENPAVDDALPDEMKQGEDTDTEATEDAQGETSTKPEQESPA